MLATAAEGPSLSSLLSGLAIGSAFARTLWLARWLRKPAGSREDAATVGDAAIVGGALGFAVVLISVFAGDGSLPVWIEVPTVTVAMQAGFGQVMGRWLTHKYGPMPYGPALPTHEQIAFTLFGAITVPGLIVFIVTMTLATVL